MPQALKPKAITEVIKFLRDICAKYPKPLVDQIIQDAGKKDPFLILISCLISLRARDTVTVHICRELFKFVKTPQEMISMNDKKLEKIIFKSGFYKNKARTLKYVSKTIIDQFGAQIPSDKQKLLSIKGIGPKTANLVLGLAFGKPEICVDTHVHRLSNIFGLISTTSPEATETKLKKVLPKKYWIEWNHLLVIFGQNIYKSGQKHHLECQIVNCEKPVCAIINIIHSNK